MTMIEGFLFGFGFILAFAVIIVLIIFFIKFKKGSSSKYAPVSAWRNYLLQVLASDNFEEAKIITELIGDKKDDQEIITPKGYKIKVEADFEIDTEGNGSKIKFNKKYKIIKDGE